MKKSSNQSWDGTRTYYSPNLDRIQDLSVCQGERFDIMFNKTLRGLRRRVTKAIDPSRIGLSKDLVASYVDDKFMMVYAKYCGQFEDDEILKAQLITSLNNYARRLMRMAYNQASVNFHLQTSSLETLYDNSKEDVSLPLSLESAEEVRLLAEWKELLYAYLEPRLTPDEWLIYQAIFNPPPFIQNRGGASIEALIDYFELPRDTVSVRYITLCKTKVMQTLEEAKADLRG